MPQNTEFPRKACPKRSSLLGGLVAGLLAFSPILSADDTEVFFGTSESNKDKFPNILFIFDTSRNMGSKGGSETSRLSRLKDAMGIVLNNTTNVNLGFMGWNGQGYGGAVYYPIQNIEDKVCQDGLCESLQAISTINASDADVIEHVIRNNTTTIDANGTEITETSYTYSSDLYAETLSATPSNDNTQEYIGLQFRDIAIPSGATITNVSLRLVAAEASPTGDSAYLLVKGQAYDSAPPYTGTPKEVASRPTVEGVDLWFMEDWIIPQDGATARYSLSRYAGTGIANIVQNIVNQDGWCGGNSIGLTLSGSGTRVFHAFDGGTGLQPQLTISYDPASVPADKGCMQRELVAQISQGPDDAQQLLGGRQTMDVGNSVLEVPQLRGEAQRTALRFSSLRLPKEAEMVDARLELTMADNATTTASINLRAEASDNSAVIGTRRGTLSKRSSTSSSVAWTLPTASTGEVLQSPNIRSVIHEVRSRAGWSTGNALTLFIEGSMGSHSIESYEGSVIDSARLRIQYRTSGGGSVADVTVRDEILQAVQALDTFPGTPIIDSYYEAALYFAGEPVRFGRTRGAGQKANAIHRVSHPRSYSGGELVRDAACSDDNLSSVACASETITGNAVYESPIKNSCQSSHIVLLSIGAENKAEAETEIKSLVGLSPRESCRDGGTAACGTELAEWLSGTDHASFLPGSQGITTYTVLFDANGSSQLMRDIAAYGEGIAYEASSVAELVAIFQQIVDNALDIDTSFVSPGATVNQYNRLTHRSDIYFSLFKPNRNPYWAGNLKKYQVKPVNDVPRLVDFSEPYKLAVDENSGFFHEGAKSGWSTVVDGNTVALGGASEQLSLIGRNVFTDVSGNYPISLSQVSNQLHENNNLIDTALLGDLTMTSEDRTTLLKWARGVDVLDYDIDQDVTEIRKQIGDPMHSKPKIINWALPAGTDPDVTDSTIFFGTNEGFLHAVDSDNGHEVFAYMPSELMVNLQKNFDNFSSTEHPYGLDGELTSWIEHDNGDGVVDPAAGEKAWLFFGQRRGGSNYYAMDVTNRAAPKLVWKIKGGEIGTDFEEMGQSWSKPSFARIIDDKSINGGIRDVLIIGGGYDTIHDTAETAAATLRGNALYIVDARTGELVHKVKGGLDWPRMSYSIPSQITSFDSDLDGLTDTLFAADLGGQVWRFDINNFDPTATLMKGGVIARLGDTDLNTDNDTLNNRRFYYNPDVAVQSFNGQLMYSIAIGSGWRAHPLDGVVQDRFYMLLDPNVSAPPQSYGMVNGQPIRESNLVDVTSRVAVDAHEIAAMHGWMLRMTEPGEKILGRPLSIDGRVMFTSYRPDMDVAACTTAVGGGAVYTVDALTGNPAMDTNNNGTDDTSDRFTTLNHGGIPPEPAALFTEDGVVILVGPEQFEAPIDSLTYRSYWMQLSAGEE